MITGSAVEQPMSATHSLLPRRCFINGHVVDVLCTLQILTLLFTLFGLTIQKTHRGGLGLGGLVHEEAHPCFPYLIQSCM